MTSEDIELEEPRFRIQAQMDRHPYHTNIVARAYSLSSLLIKLVNRKEEAYLEDRHILEIQIYDEEKEIWVNCNKHLEDLTDPEERMELEKDIMAGKIGRTLWDMVT